MLAGGQGMKVVVIGGGIAGASVAYFAAQQGCQVTVVDAGLYTASHVPSAVINPVRGQAGRLPEGAVEGLDLIWQLIEQLRERFPIPHGKTGLLRPVPDDKTRQKFERHLTGALPLEWVAPQDCSVTFSPGWAHVLHLPQGGWVDGHLLTSALLAASGAELIRGRAQSWHAQEVGVGVRRLGADAVVWCGGAVGAGWRGEERTHRGGSVLTTSQPLTAVPVSFGAYLTPAARGGVIGSTFEAPTTLWQAPQLSPKSLAWLLGKAQALVPLQGQIDDFWSGARLSELRVGQQPDGTWELSGLGSKGFLLGPLLARDLVTQLAQGHA